MVSIADAVADSVPADTAGAGTQRTLPHQPALDGLRGLAVAAVLLFHGDHLTGGYLGVDAFFVLSGFLITSLLLVEHGATGRIALGHFWARRARRLLPALACVLAAVALYAAFVANSNELATIRGDAFSTLLYGANWHAIASGGDYFAIFRNPSPLQHTWSLAIEEQFYLVWPLVLALFLGRRRGKRESAPSESARRVFVLSLVLTAGSAVLAQLLYDPADPARVYYGTDTRAAAILLGAALAAALVAWGPVTGARARRMLESAAIVAAATLLVTWTHLSGSSDRLYRGGLLLCGIAVAVVIMAAVHPTRGPVSVALSFAPLRGLGIISYGVYLWHWPVFVWLSPDRTGTRGWPLFALQCAVTLALSLASYRLVERPIRSGAGSTRAMLGAVPITAAVLVVALIMATPASSLSTIPGWLPDRNAIPKATDAQWQRTLAHLRDEAVANKDVTRVLVFGDSIALTLSRTPTGTYHSETTNGVGIGFIGCSLLGDPRYFGRAVYPAAPGCDNWPALLTSLVDAYRPQIVATMLGPWELFDRRVNGTRENAGTARLTQDLEARLTQLDHIVTGGNARLVVLTTPCYSPPPRLPFGESRVFRSPIRIAWINRVWRDYVTRNPDTASIGNLSALLCPGGHALENRVGDKYREDGMHFTPAGAALVWHWIDSQVVRPAALSRGGTDQP